MRAHVLLAAAALAVLAAGCGGSGDKAGGRAETVATPVGRPVTLTLVTPDGLWDSTFADAVARLSGGTMRIEIQVEGGRVIDSERRTVEHLRAGRAELASVGARVWDTMGVTSLRALVAPFLVDSFSRQRRALESPLAARMLDGLDPARVVGIALLPGPLRRPLAVSRPLRAPADFEGRTIGIRPGGVARDTFRALGASAKGYLCCSLSALDGAELDLNTIAEAGYDTRGSRLTANAVLWPRAVTIVMNRDAFQRLPLAQRDVLRRAGREAVAPDLAKLAVAERFGLEAVCGRGNVSLVDASPTQIAALHQAVRPVYAELERDAETREAIAAIRRLEDGSDNTQLRCPATRKASPEGVWEANVSRAEMRANGASEAEAVAYPGRATLELRNGRWTFRTAGATVTGTYEVAGDTVRLTMKTCTANPCSPGAFTEYFWSVYRDTLTLRRRPGRPFWPRLVARPAHRVG